MGLEEVKQDIIASAEREAQRLQDEAHAEAALIKKEAEKQIDAYRISSAEDSKRIAQQLERRECAQAAFDAKKRLLDKKKDIIDRVVSGVAARLDQEPEKKRRVILRNLLAKARSDIPLGHISVKRADCSLMRALVRGIPVREKQMLGGLVAETPDGSISVDYSYDQFLGRARDACIHELHRILFGQQ